MNNRIKINKRFGEWINLKESLNKQINRPPFVSEGDVWWISIGENVGSEINGKDILFSRPAVIFKKLAHGFYFVIPTTTKQRKGTWYIGFKHQSICMAACLHQARAVDYQRLSSKFGTLDNEGFTRIKKGFQELYII